MPKLLTSLIIVLFASACASGATPTVSSQTDLSTSAATAVPPTAAPNPEPVTSAPQTVNIAQAQPVTPEERLTQ